MSKHTILNQAPRVLFLITRADAVGGASIHTRDMAAALHRSGGTVLIGVGGQGPVTEGYRNAGAPFVSLRWFRREISPWRDLLALCEVVRLIRNFRPDLVSAHTSKAGFIGRLAAWLCGVPVIYTPHCWSFVDGFPRARLYLNLERFAAVFSTRIVAVSEDERQQGLAKGVGSARLITTIHNGMPDVAAHLRADPSVQRPQLLMTGRFEEQKDQDTLLRALAQLRHLDWSLDLVGDGPRLQAMQELAVELGLGERVRFLGYRKDVPDLLAASQIYLLITHWEGFPRSILEAMRAGLPVIATDVGGSREAVAEGRSGFLVPRGDHAMLARRLEALISEPGLRASMGRHARATYEERFTFEAMLEKYRALYASLMPRDRSGAGDQ